MVGVPGRSKGCHTCRRRKVKCDEAKPLCNRCSKAGLNCEGYLKHAIYVHRNVDGLLKRRPLEEIIASQSRHKATLKEVELTHVWRCRIEEYFLEKFLAADHSHQNPSPGSYVLEAISGITRDSLLESAIEALCLSRVGRLTGDDRLLRRGFQSYSTALQKLDTAVSNDSMIIKDTTCAAAKIMNLHEFYEPSYNSGEAVYVHTIGIETILEKRGPCAFSTGPMKALLKASRYNSMITMIKGRSSYSPLADPKWKCVLVEGIDGIEYALHGIGFEVASLIHSLDNYQRSRQKIIYHQDETVIQELMRQCSSIYRLLKDWYADFTIQCPSPIYWHDDQAGYCAEDIPSLQFPHIIIAHIITDYWALNILLGRLVGTLSKIIKASDFQHSVSLSEFNDLAVSYCNNTLILYALKIVASADYCSRQEAGLAGADHLFALEVSLKLFRKLSGAYPRKLEEKTAEILNRLALSGLQFGASLVRPSVSTDWSRLI